MALSLPLCQNNDSIRDSVCTHCVCGQIFLLQISQTHRLNLYVGSLHMCRCCGNIIWNIFKWKGRAGHTILPFHTCIPCLHTSHLYRASVLDGGPVCFRVLGSLAKYDFHNRFFSGTSSYLRWQAKYFAVITPVSWVTPRQTPTWLHSQAQSGFAHAVRSSFGSAKYSRWFTSEWVTCVVSATATRCLASSRDMLSKVCVCVCVSSGYVPVCILRKTMQINPQIVVCGLIRVC